MKEGNYDCPVCHRFDGLRIGQHLNTHKTKGQFSGRIDWSGKSYLKNGAAPASETGASLIDRYNALLAKVEVAKKQLAEERDRLHGESAKIEALLAGKLPEQFPHD